MTSSCIDAATLKAYRETDYGVQGNTPFVLRIDCFSPTLAGLHALHRVDCSAYITACNPFSRLAEVAFNAQRQQQLAGDLQATGRVWLAGAGRHPAGLWPEEPSFLVMGMTCDEAVALGKKYEQNAVVCCGLQAVPRLVLLR